MSNAPQLPTLSSPDALSAYLAQIRSFPMLSAEEEYMLAKRWREHGDREAAHKLVTSHLRFVAKIAMGYRGYGLPVGDLISEGHIGLMQAVKKYDPDKGFRLATYAMWWIRASIQEYILHSWSLVKIGTTAAQKKLFFNLRRMKSKLGALDDHDLPPEQVKEIATDLKVSEREVVEMNRRLSGPDHSLNAPKRGDGEGDSEWQDFLAESGEGLEAKLLSDNENNQRAKLLANAISRLDARERRIIQARALSDEPTTLEDLSAEFGVSRERVRQIESRAMTKVQADVRAQATVLGLPVSV
jgi:RNA polymerase sigma-32 factor